MNAELKAKWVKALRSGWFPQTRGRLRRADGYCCLGVLCAVKGLQFRPDTFDPLMPDGSDPPQNSYESLFGADLDRATRDHLVHLNDSIKNSFDEIADYIEKNL